MAKEPGASPGARIHVGVGTSSRRIRCRVRCASASYSTRPSTALVSMNSCTWDVRFSASWSKAQSRPSASAATLTRWAVGLR